MKQHNTKHIDLEPPSRGELDSTATRKSSAETKSHTPKGIPTNIEDSIHSTNHTHQTHRIRSHKKRGTRSDTRTKERAEKMKERRNTIPDKRMNETYFKTHIYWNPELDNRAGPPVSQQTRGTGSANNQPYIRNIAETATQTGTRHSWTHIPKML